MDADQIWNLLAPIPPTTPGTTLALALPQASDEFFLERPTRHNIKRVVDALVRYLTVGIIRIHTLECAAYLLR